MLYLIATLRVRPGNHPELMKAAHAMVAASNEEPGCLYYDLNVSISDPHVMVFVERWESREALELHINSEHMNVWSKANKGYFIERKAELIYPDRVEDIPFVDPK